MEELVAESTRRGRSYGLDYNTSGRDEEFEDDFIVEVDNKGDGEDDIVVLDEVVSSDDPTTDEIEDKEDEEAAQQNADIVPPSLVEKPEFAMRM